MDKVLVIMAHPDDAELTVGGTIAGWVKEGKEVRYIICSAGEKGTKDRGMSPHNLAGIREREQEEAARVLGVSDVTFLRHRDGELDVNLAFREELSIIIREYMPKTIVTHDPWRPYMLHPDHRAVGFTTCDAVVAARDHLFFSLHVKLGLSPHEPDEIYFTLPQEPDVCIDITDTIDKKIEALSKYKSQLDRYAGWEGWLRDWACEAAKKEKFEFGEAFKRVVTVHPIVRV